MHLDHFGQWAFDRSDRLDDARHERDPVGGAGLVAVVISADGAHRMRENRDLVEAVKRQMATQCGLPTQTVDARVIVEKRATFACVPDLPRPDVDLPHPRLVLAGDYVAESDVTTRYPATLEAAVIAGQRAADRLIATLRTR